MPTVKETCSCGATYEATHGAVIPSTDEFRALHQPCRDRAAYGPPQNPDSTEREERRQALNRRANAWHVEHCRPKRGDGKGNEWCGHDVQVAWVEEANTGETMPGFLSGFLSHSEPAANPDRTTT